MALLFACTIIISFCFIKSVATRTFIYTIVTLIHEEAWYYDMPSETICISNFTLCAIHSYSFFPTELSKPVPYIFIFFIFTGSFLFIPIVPSFIFSFVFNVF